MKERTDYETLCRLAGVYPMLKSVDWYWHFNELKGKLKTPSNKDVVGLIKKP